MVLEIRQVPRVPLGSVADGLEVQSPADSIDQDIVSCLVDDGVTRFNYHSEILFTSLGDLIAELEIMYIDLTPAKRRFREAKDRATKPHDRQMQDQTALHRILLREHHDLFLLSQNPSVSPTLRRLTSVYTAPARAMHKKLGRNVYTPLPGWLKFLTLTTSLLHLLYENETALERRRVELEDMLEEVEEIFNKLHKHFKRKFRELSYAAILTELLCKFPGNMRYRCTTMPWTIWPALVVLWGVCWMFAVPPSGFEHVEQDAAPSFLPSPLLPTARSLPSEAISAFGRASGTSGVDFLTVDFSFDPDLSWLEPWNDGARGFVADNPSFDIEGALPERSSQIASKVVTYTVQDDPSQRRELSDDFMGAAPQPPRAPNFQCSYCQKSFTRNSSLRRHEIAQHLGIVGEFPCPHCNKAYQRKEHLKRHLKTDHQSRDRSPENTTPQSFRDELRREQPLIIGMENRHRFMESKSNRRKRKVSGDGDEAVSISRVVENWKRKYKVRLETLEEKERECQRERARLEAFSLCIQNLEDDGEDGFGF